MVKTIIKKKLKQIKIFFFHFEKILLEPHNKRCCKKNMDIFDIQTWQHVFMLFTETYNSLKISYISSFLFVNLLVICSTNEFSDRI